MALRVEKWGGLRPCRARRTPQGRGNYQSLIAPVGAGAGPVRGGQPLAGPAVAWVAEMGSAGGGKPSLVCKVGESSLICKVGGA